MLVVITYEYPLNERIRTLLRLEDLYDRVAFFIDKASPLDHQAALVGIFEILEVSSRGDLKSDLLQELDRQRLFLETLRSIALEPRYIRRKTRYSGRRNRSGVRRVTRLVGKDWPTFAGK